MAKLKVTQTVSRAGANKRQMANLEALGLHKIHQTVVVESTPVALGMIARVNHMVKVEEVKK